MVEMDKIVSLSKRRGFIFQSSEIYGGTGSCWDYGPLGVELKNDVKCLVARFGAKPPTSEDRFLCPRVHGIRKTFAAASTQFALAV